MDAVNDPTMPSPDTGASPALASMTEPGSHERPPDHGPATQPDQQNRPATVHPDGVRLAIVIADVHGQVRAERFKKSEVSIGRDGTNDLPLVADGISREHAVLTVSADGACLIIDLGSTNGTFVNHRNIERQPTQLHEQDQVAIGKLALRVRGYAAPVKTSGQSTDDPRTLLRSMPEGATRITSVSTPAAGSGMTAVMTAQPTEPQPLLDDAEEPTFDGSESMTAPAAPTAPAVPAAAPTAPAVPAAEPTAPAVPAAAPTPAAAELTADEPFEDSLGVSAGGTEVRQVGSPQPRRQELVAQLVEEVTREVGAEALRTLELNADTFEPADGATRARVDTTLDDTLRSLPSSEERDAIRQAARQQLLGLGPVAALMRTASTERIRVLTTRAEALCNGRWTSAELDFSSSEAAAWALSRLLRAGGGEPGVAGVVTLSLRDGWTLHAIGASAAGPLFELVRRRDEIPSLRDLCLDGALSQDMVEWLESALARRANLFISCERHSGAEAVARALAEAVHNPEQTLWLAEPDTTTPDGVVTLSVGADEGRYDSAVTALEEISCPYLVAPFLSTKPLAALSKLTLRGRRGVLAPCWGHTLEAALDLACAALMAAHPTLERRSAQARLSASFDVGVELRLGDDGRLRFTRLATLQPGDDGTQVHDVFRFFDAESGFRVASDESAAPPPTTDRSA